MLTRCPACETTFRVTPDQLKIRSGRVRCGECQYAFSALDTLVEEAPVVINAPAPIQVSASDNAPAPEQGKKVVAIPAIAAIPLAEEPSPVSIDAELADLAKADPIPDISLRGKRAELPSMPSTVTQEKWADQEPIPTTAQVIAQAKALARPPEPQPQAVPPIVEAAHWNESFFVPPAPSRSWPWVLGVVASFTLLTLQAAIALRVEWSVLQPQAKPLILALCNIVGCELGLPQKIELLGIESSNLQPNTENKKLLVLTATLKNRAPFVQQLPNLELTLTDIADKAIARKVLAPSDYLKVASADAPGMEANGDLAVSIDIDPTDLVASGYRLYLFYP